MSEREIPLVAPKRHPGRKFLGALERYPIAAAAVLALILCAVAYAPSLRSPVFVQNDESVLNLPLPSHFKNAPIIFSRDFLLFTSGEYRPAGYVLLSVVRTFITPDRVLFWHSFLLGFHVLNALLVFTLTRRFASRFSTPFVAAALFCVHPLCTVQVNDVNQFPFILGTALVLGVLNAYAAFAMGGKKSAYVFALVLYFAALFTIRQALAVGLVLLAYEGLYNKPGCKKAALRLLPFAALPLLFYRSLVMASPHPLHFKYVKMYDGSFWDGFFSVTGATGFIVNGMLSAQTIPMILHEVADHIFNWNNPQFLFWASFNAIVCGASIWALWRRWWAAWGVLFVYLCMLPYATVYLNRVDDYVSFVYYYFPVAGLAFLVSGVFERLQNSTRVVLKHGSAVCILALLIFWGGRTVRLNAAAKDPVSYWSDVVSKTKDAGKVSPTASVRLGEALLERGDVSSALQCLFSPETESPHDSCLVMADYYIDRKEYLAAAVHLHYCMGTGQTGIVYQSKSEAAARLYAAVGALDHAEDNLGVVLMVNPYNARMMALLARVWLWKGYVREAARMLDRIRAYDPNDPYVNECQRILDRYERNVREGASIDTPPSPSVDWLNYAFGRKRSPAVRKEIVELSRRVDARDSIVQLEAMLSLMEDERYEDALAKADGVYGSLQNNSFACTVLCDLLAKTNRVNAAVEMGVRALQIDRNNKVAWKNLAVAYAQKEKLDESDKFFLEQIDGNPSFASTFYFNLGMQKRRKGNNKEAIELMEKALQANPHNSDIYLILGETLTIDGQPSRAYDILKQSLALERDDPNIYANMGIALNALQRWDEGGEAFDTAIKLNPDNHYYHYNYAVGLMNQNEMDEAIVEYQRAVDLKPDFLQAVLQLGYCLLRVGRLDEAAAQYKIIIRADPNYRYAHYNLGSIYRMQKKYDRAVAEFEEEIERNPDVAAPYDALAQIYCQLGETDRAKTVLDRAFARKIQPNARTVERVQAALGR